MPFWKKIHREAMRIEKDIRAARDVLIRRKKPEPVTPETVSEPVPDGGHLIQTIDQINIPDSSNNTKLASDIDLLEPVISLQDNVSINTSNTQDNSLETSEPIVSTNVTLDDEPNQYPITKFSDQYEQSVKDIDLYISTETPVDDVPSSFPNPDFSLLEPLKGDLDVDDDYDILEPFLDEEDQNVDEDKKKQMEVSAPMIWESSRQEDNSTEDYYSNNSSERGLGLIFINYDLTFDKTNRRQFENRVENLERLLSEKLEFQVEQYRMTSEHHVKKILQTVHERKEAEGDCLLVAILSQGFRDQSGREFLYCGQDLVEPLALWTVLDGTCCIPLANKPKIFLQLGWAIKREEKGLREDSGNLYTTSRIVNVPGIHKIPNMSHFFIISAVEQGWNWQIEREMVNNFIDHFIKLMNSYSHIWDFAKIMTLVQYHITWSVLSSDNADNDDKSVKKRAGYYSRSPSFTSSLMRKILFKPKESN